MNDPVSLQSIETPILTTKHNIIYEVETMFDRKYYVFDKQSESDIFYGTLQDCFNYVIGYYNLYQMR